MRTLGTLLFLVTLAIPRAGYAHAILFDVQPDQPVVFGVLGLVVLAHVGSVKVDGLELAVSGTMSIESDVLVRQSSQNGSIEYLYSEVVMLMDLSWDSPVGVQTAHLEAPLGRGNVLVAEGAGPAGTYAARVFYNIFPFVLPASLASRFEVSRQVSYGFFRSGPLIVEDDIHVESRQGFYETSPRAQVVVPEPSIVALSCVALGIIASRRRLRTRGSPR